MGAKPCSCGRVSTARRPSLLADTGAPKKSKLVLPFSLLLLFSLLRPPHMTQDLLCCCCWLRPRRSRPPLRAL
jgi:hypothetical protein